MFSPLIHILINFILIELEIVTMKFPYEVPQIVKAKYKMAKTIYNFAFACSYNFREKLFLTLVSVKYSREFALL